MSNAFDDLPPTSPEMQALATPVGKKANAFDDITPPAPEEITPPQQVDAQGRPWHDDFIQQTGRQVGLAGRSIIHGIAGIPEMAADVGVAGRNLAHNLANGVTPTLADFNPFAKSGGTHQEYELPSHSFNQALTSAGLPNPQNLTEGLTGAVMSGVAGAKMPNPEVAGTPAGFVNEAQAKAQRLASSLSKSQGAGFVVPPSTTNPSWWNKTIETIGGKEATQNQARVINQSARNAGAATDLGLKPEVFTPEAVAAVKNEAGQAFQQARGIPRFNADETYSADLDKVLSQTRGANADFPGASNPDVEKLVETYRQPSMTGNSAVSAVQLLRQKASDAYRNGQSELGAAYKGISAAIERQTERGALSLEQKPDPQQFSLDMGFAKQGDVSARQLFDKAVPTTHGPEGVNGPMVYDSASGSWKIQPQTQIKTVQETREFGPSQQTGLPFSTRAPESFGPQPQAAPQGQYSTLVDALRKARKTYAQASTVEEAMDPEGNVSGPKLAAAWNRDEPLSGNVLTAARHAASYPKANLPANSSNISHLNVYGAPALSVLAEHATGSPWALAAGAALPVGRAGARSYLLSGMGQAGGLPGQTSKAAALARALSKPSVMAAGYDASQSNP